MTDKKALAVGVGTAVGIAAVATTVWIYAAKHKEAHVANVDDVLEQARRTVQKIDKTVDLLKKSQS